MRSLCSGRRWSSTGIVAASSSPLHRRSSQPSHAVNPSSPSPSRPSSHVRSAANRRQLLPAIPTAHVQQPSNAMRPATMASSANGTGRPPYTVFIEGNVGSGKTTFLEHFASCPNVFLAKEPVHVWQNVRGHNFLVRVTHFDVTAF